MSRLKLQRNRNPAPECFQVENEPPPASHGAKPVDRCVKDSLTANTQVFGPNSTEKGMPPMNCHQVGLADSGNAGLGAA